MGSNYIYWTDWDSKTLWSLLKDGSQEEPTALRYYTQKPMAVIVFQHEPPTCQILPTTAEIQYTTASFVLPQDIEQVAEVTEETENLCIGYCYNNGQCLNINSEKNCL